MYWKIPPLPGARWERYQLLSFEGKNTKRGREKGGIQYVKEKEERGKEKEERGKEK